MPSSIFVTGPKGIGKSHILKQVVAELMQTNPYWRLGGFITKPIDKQDRTKGFHLISVDPKLICGADVFYPRGDSGLHQQTTNLFETWGCTLMENAAECDIVILDEIGFAERDATRFQASVLKLITSDVLVLGALRQATAPLIERIKQTDSVYVYTATLQNRATLAKTIVDSLVTWDIIQARDVKE